MGQGHEFGEPSAPRGAAAGLVGTRDEGQRRPITIAIEAVMRELDHLEEAATQLVTRLAPLSGPKGPKPPQEKAKEEPGSSVGAFLHNTVARVRSLREELKDAAERLEL